MVDSFQGTAIVESSFTGVDAVNIIKNQVTLKKR